MLVDCRISVLIFEVHMKATPESRPDYKSVHGVIRDLDTLGYECLLPLQEIPKYQRTSSFFHSLWSYMPLLGCDDERSFRKLRGWKNVLCYNRKNLTVRGVFEDIQGTLRGPRREWCIV